jgi:hypothetical protein
MLVGLALITFHLAIPHYMGAYVVWVIPEYAIAAVMAAALSGSVESVGLTITVALNIVNVLLTFVVYRQNMARYLPYAVTNIIFNAILFGSFGSSALRMMPR